MQYTRAQLGCKIMYYVISSWEMIFLNFFVRPKCIELQRICEQYKEVVRKRHEMLQKSRDLQERIEKVKKKKKTVLVV